MIGLPSQGSSVGVTMYKNIVIYRLSKSIDMIYNIDNRLTKISTISPIYQFGADILTI